MTKAENRYVYVIYVDIFFKLLLIITFNTFATTCHMCDIVDYLYMCTS